MIETGSVESRTRSHVPGAMALAVAALALGCASPARAMAGESGWAQCVWQTAPVSAANWLAMAAPQWADNMATPAERLGHRLLALCATRAAEENRPNRNPPWSRLMATLRSARPRAPGAADAAQPAALLCHNRISEGGRTSVYRMDVVRLAADGARMIVFQQYFMEHEGNRVRVPQDIRQLPGTGADLSAECWAITATGTLAGA